jgi:hypothetical protein
LVEVAVLQTLTVQRNRNERPTLCEGWCKARVGECLVREPTELAGEGDFPPIFQAVNQIERARVTHHRRSSEFKREAELVAVRAGEGSIDLSWKGFAAILTKRLGELRKVIVAAVAQRAAIG